MTPTTALATITPQEWPMVLKQAEMLVQTGFLPRAVDTPQKAVAIMMKGRELNVPPMYALSNIVIIQGKPAANAELMLALIYRDHGDDAIVFAETTDTTCSISYKRRNWRGRKTYDFTIEQARAAKLTGENWSKYPAAMLRARCISAVARLAFPDTIAGMYTPEELGATADMETGEIAAPVRSLPDGQHVNTVTGEIIDAPTVEDEPEPEPVAASRPGMPALNRPAAIKKIKALWARERDLIDTYPAEEQAALMQEQNRETDFDLENLSADALIQLGRTINARVEFLPTMVEDDAVTT